MIYRIFRNNISIASIKPLSSSNLVQKSEVDDYIELNFEMTNFVDFKVGDYIYYAESNSVYKLNFLPNIVNESGKYVYSCIFQGNIYDLNKVKCFLDTDKGGGLFNRDYNFELTGNAKTFLEFIVSCMNREYSGYVVGEYDDTSVETISFNNFNVYQAILAVQEKFSFRWRLENKTLHFKEKQGDYAYLFKVGRLQGFTSLERLRTSESKIITSLYGYGSTDNLPVDYESDGLYDRRLSFTGEEGFSKLSKNIDKYGIIQEVVEFDIRPEYTGSITAIDASNIRLFYDSNVDFDINNNLLPGVVPTVKFISGNLSGTEFPITYNSNTGSFTVDVVTKDDISLPNETIKFKVGDQFKILNISMPSQYVIDAENELQQATSDYLDKWSQPQQYFEADVDRQYIGKNNIKLKLYDIIRCVAPAFGIDNLYPIQELTQNIADPDDYNIKFGDILPKSLLTRLEIANFNTSNSITNISNTTVNTNDITNIIGDENQWL